jgi:hypothetical protein
MKYIRHDKLGFIMWQSIGGEPRHSDVATFMVNSYGGAILSAGFVMDMGDGPRCFGDSGSLNLGGLPDDTDALKQQLAS